MGGQGLSFVSKGLTLDMNPDASITCVTLGELLLCLSFLIYNMKIVVTVPSSKVCGQE